MLKEKNNEGFLCPRCGDLVFKEHPALSRRDNKTKICSNCGIEEAMFDLKMYQHWNTEEEKKFLIEKEKKWLRNK